MSKRKRSKIRNHIRDAKEVVGCSLIQVAVYAASIIDPNFSESFQSDGDDWHAIGFAEMDERLSALKEKKKKNH